MTPTSSSVALGEELLPIVSQLIGCVDLSSAAPLLADLSTAFGDELLICLPPINESRPFSLIDFAALDAWLQRGAAGQSIPVPPEAAVIRSGARVMGQLIVDRHARLDDTRLDLLGLHLGTVLDRWQQHRQYRRAISEKETLVRLCRAVNASRDMQAVLAEAHEALQGSVPMDAFVATVYDPATDMNVLSYSVEHGQHSVDSFVGPVPNSLQGYILRHGKVLRFDDLPEEIAAYPGVQIMRYGSDSPMRAWLGVPLLLGDGRAVGVLSVQHHAPQVYSEHDRLFLEQAAVSVAIAIEKTMLLQQRDREIAVLTAQTELSEALGHAHDINMALDGALAAVEKSFPAHAYLIYILDEQLRVEASAIKENGTIFREGYGELLDPGGLSSYILHQPRPILFRNEAELIEAGVGWSHVGDLDQPTTETVMGAALQARDGSRIGLISVQSYNRNAYDARHAALLGSIARQVALVVENARLSQQDHERLQALERANHELEQAQHRALAAERRRAIGDIAAGVAHDFNNLLGAILGNAQLIALTGSLNDARDMASTIEVAARDAATIVRRIQEFTRSRDAVERTPVDVAHLLYSAVSMTRPKWRDEAQLRGLAVQIAYQIEPVEPVLGVETELREVLVNLVINAVDALAADGTLMLGCGQRGGNVLIFVRDTGSGMPPDILARAGQPFFSTKGTLGSGLGLAVSQGIVQRHGGELLIDSKSGLGTTVTLQLPTARAQTPRPRWRSNEGSRIGSIVLVEDDANLRSATQRILEHAGHRVHAFGAGSEALEHLRAQPSDLLLTDLGLPGMSGWEVAQAAQAAQPNTRVLLVTGWGDRVAPDDARRCGVMEVLSKPLEHHALLAAVDRSLRCPAANA